MKRAIRYAGIAVLSASFALAATSAGAETSKVGGGTWYHGFSGVNVYSNYYHPTAWHRSSVTTQYDYYSSPWKAKAETSYACLQSSLQGNKANYDYI